MAYLTTLPAKELAHSSAVFLCYLGGGKLWSRERTQYSWTSILRKSMHWPNELLAASPLEPRPLLFSPDNCWQNIFAKHSPTLLKTFIVLLLPPTKDVCVIFVPISCSFCPGSCEVLSLLAIFCRRMEGKEMRKRFFPLAQMIFILSSCDVG